MRIALALPAGAYVVEIGGGTGSLTAALLPHARQVTSLEIDRDLACVLRERFADNASHLKVVTHDILLFDLTADLRTHDVPRAVCGNLPYYITTPILERLFEASDDWDCAVVMVQREYARRLLAAPKTPEYGSLSVYAAYFVQVEKLFDIGAAGCYPAPDIASSALRLTPRFDRQSSVRDERVLLWLIRAAFSHRRKTLVNSVRERMPQAPREIRAMLESAVAHAGLNVSVRAEQLTLRDFCALADTIKEQGLMEFVCTTQTHPSR